MVRNHKGNTKKLELAIQLPITVIQANLGIIKNVELILWLSIIDDMVPMWEERVLTGTNPVPSILKTKITTVFNFMLNTLHSNVS